MKVLFFASLAEITNRNEMEIEAGSVRELKDRMHQKFPGLSKAEYVIAVNRKIVHDDQNLAGAEQVAFLPPFSGG